jgi:hypothetical protein
MAEIKKKCQENSVQVGMFVMNAEDAQKEIDDGCKFIVVGIDSALLWNAAKNALDTVLRMSCQKKICLHASGHKPLDCLGRYRGVGDSTYCCLRLLAQALNINGKRIIVLAP